MACEYQCYKEELNEPIPPLYCNIDNTKCLFSKMCNEVNRYISIDNLKQCYKIMEYKKRQIPTGSNYIVTRRPSPKGIYLYIEIEDQIVKIEFLDKNYSKDYIYVIKDGDVIILSETPPTRAKRYAKKE